MPVDAVSNYDNLSLGAATNNTAVPVQQNVPIQEANNQPIDTALFTSDNAKALGGIVFDINGNLISNNGTTMFNKTEATQKLNELQNTAKQVANEATQEPAIEYFINEDSGELVKADGTVVKKKGEFTENADGSIVIAPESKLKSVLDFYTNERGFDFKDENGASLQFDESPTSIQALTEYVANKTYETKFKQTIDQMPDVKALMEHIITGRNPLEFYESKLQAPDYTNLNIDDNNTNQVELALMEYYTKVAKLDETTASKFIKMAQDSGQSKDLVKTAVEGLKKWSVDAKQNEEKARVAEVTEIKERSTKFWKGVEETVMKGKLEDIAVPELERKSFLDFISKDTGNGKTKSIMTYEALPLEQRLKVDYWIYKGLNLDTVVKKAVQTQQVNNLKLRAAKVRVESSIPETRINNPRNYENLNIRNII